MTITPFNDAVPAMTTDEARACVETINQQINGARADLLRLYEGRGWEALGYESWRACAVAEFGQSQARVYQLLQAAEIERRVSTKVEIDTIPERHLRPLAVLPEDQQAEAYLEAVETAPEGKPTAAHVAATVDRFRRADVDAAPVEDMPQEQPPRPLSLVPDAVITPTQTDISYVFQGGDVRRSNLSKRFNKVIGPFLDSGAVDADLLREVTPEEMAGLLNESDLLQEPAVIPLAAWIQAVYAAYHNAPALRRVK